MLKNRNSSVSFESRFNSQVTMKIFVSIFAIFVLLIALAGAAPQTNKPYRMPANPGRIEGGNTRLNRVQ